MGYKNVDAVPIFILISLMILSHSAGSQTVKDFDGNTYPVMLAGNYLWTAENIRVTHDAEGNELGYYTVENPYMDQNSYGYLYSWYTAMDSVDSVGTQGICPDGWHLPTDAEWDSLVEWAGGIVVSGKKLMDCNPGKFSALLVGNYNPIQKIYSYFGEQAYFWTSSSFSYHTAWMRNMGKPKKNTNRSTTKKHYGFSVRCVRKVR